MTTLFSSCFVFHFLFLCWMTNSFFFSLVPPSIVRRQRDVNINLGTRVTLVCDAQGEPTPEYRWTRNRLPVQYSHRIQSVDNTLVIQRVQFSDAGRYECIAENVEGIDRSSFYLNVLCRYFYFVLVVFGYIQFCNILKYFVYVKFFINFISKSSYAL